MANNKIQEDDISRISGISIVRNGDRLLYSPFFSNKGYIITPSNARHYTHYITGYIAALVAITFGLIFTKNLIISLLIGLLVVIIDIAFFYVKFIKTASTVTFKDTGKQTKESVIVRQARDQSYARIKELIICSILLVIIFVGYYFWQKPEDEYFWVVLISGITSFIYLLFNITVWFYKKKHFDE